MSDETWKERVAYAAYATLERAGMALPEFIGRPVFDAGALVAFPLARRVRAVVAGNIGRVLGRDADDPLVQAAAKEAFRGYARYWYDTFHIRTLSDEELDRRMRVEGLEHLEAAITAERGAVLALPHMGNWDAAGRWVSTRWKMTAVAELLRPERLFRLFLDHRVALGMNVIPLEEDRKAAEELVRLVAENHLIALVADRDLKNKGVTVEMFGAERMMPAGPALLSLGTGAPLHPCACYDLEDGWMFTVDEPLEIERTDNLRADVTTLTRELARRFERAIAAAPTQWHMFQPAWEETEGPEHAPAAAASL